MNNIENIIRQKLTYRVFLSVSFFVIALPILFNFEYMLFGKKVDGVMIGVESVGNVRAGAEVSIIKYSVGDKIYECAGPINVIFEEREVVELYYIKTNPQNATLASPVHFYFTSSGLNSLCAIFLIFWIAIFSTYGNCISGVFSY